MDEFARVDVRSIQPNTHSFVVKVRLNDHAWPSGQVTWCGRITHVPSGRCKYFSKTADMTVFVTFYLQQLGVKPTLRSKEPVDATRDISFVRLPFLRPDARERLQLWQIALAEHAVTAVEPAVDLAAVASKFRVSGGQIHDMEEYEGMAVLATNVRKNMDEAFVRRLHVTVEAPVSGVDDRRRTWDRIWPAATPRDPGLDLELVARAHRGDRRQHPQHRPCARLPAAADGGVVTMQHLFRAAQREYQKKGKLLTASEFGE